MKTCNQILTEHMRAMVDKKSGNNEYGRAHVDALSRARRIAQGNADKHKMEFAIVRTILGVVDYADAHAMMYESTIGNDGVLGESWLEMVKSIKGMLNGETGRLDKGGIDTLLRELSINVGFEAGQYDE